MLTAKVLNSRKSVMKMAMTKPGTLAVLSWETPICSAIATHGTAPATQP
jgi:hypothetical protein